MTVVLNLCVLAGMLVVLPVGLRLIEGIPEWVPWAWLAAAGPGAVSVWLPRGPAAATLAGIYALAGFALAGYGLARFRTVSPRAVALVTALVTPTVAGFALVAERAGYGLFGFPLRVLALTVAHFHFAGFAAALIAALLCVSTHDGRAARVAAACVPAGTAVVLVGFFSGPVVELLGAAVLTVGMWLVAGVTWREIRPRVTDRVTRGLLAVGAGVLLASMLLALNWAAGRALGLAHLSLDAMIATHGVANALGFGVCSALAWLRIVRSPEWKI